MNRSVRLILIVAPLTVLAAVVPLATANVATAGARTPDASAGFSMSSYPPLAPSFSPTVSDYALRCPGWGTAPYSYLETTGTGRVEIGGKLYTNPTTVALPLVPGQEVKVVQGGSQYYLRCLPGNFPAYTTTVTGTTQADGYFVTVDHYAAAFDTDGVPIWWDYDGDTNSPIDAKFLSPSTVSWSDSSYREEIHALDGKLIHTVGGQSVPLDPHDLQLLPNGNYLGILDLPTNCPSIPSQCVDLSSWGLSSQAQIDNEWIVELDKSNHIVWEWSVMDHVDIATANVNWRDQYPDVIHMNSIMYDGNGGIIWSARHLDAVYRIDMASGDITWKLGGSSTPQSLTVSGDPYLDAGGQLFSGQHDARFAPDGSLTVHDNGSRANRAPRAVRFDVQAAAKTATEVEQVTDSRAPAAPFTGSVEKLLGGDWVASWGDNDFVTELTPAGAPVLTISYPGYFSYRDADVLASRDALRRGMNAMVAPLRL
jgi:hypothetical protein